MKIQIINKSGFDLPKYATSGSAGMDLKTTKDLILYPGGRVLAPTGLYMALPQGYEAQIRPRSGLALKKGITVLNSPGTIDSDYRGEVGVVLINHSNERVDFNTGDRIAQMVIAKYETAEWDEVNDLDDTDRGNGGFGHSGYSDKMTKEQFMEKHNFSPYTLGKFEALIPAVHDSYFGLEFLSKHNMTRQQIIDFKENRYGYIK